MYQARKTTSPWCEMVKPRSVLRIREVPPRPPACTIGAGTPVAAARTAAPASSMPAPQVFDRAVALRLIDRIAQLSRRGTTHCGTRRAVAVVAAGRRERPRGRLQQEPRLVRRQRRLRREHQCRPSRRQAAPKSSCRAMSCSCRCRSTRPGVVVPELEVVRIGYRHAEPGSVLTQLPAGRADRDVQAEIGEADLGADMAQPGHGDDARTIGGRADGMPDRVARGGDDHGSGRDDLSDRIQIRRRAVAGAAEAHVDHARGVRVGRDARNGKTGRPAHPGDECRSRSRRTCRERAPAARADWGRRPPCPIPLLVIAAMIAGHLRAVPRAVLGHVLPGGRIERAALVEDAVGVVRLGGRDPIAGIRRIGIARVAVVGDVLKSKTMS